MRNVVSKRTVNNGARIHICTKILRCGPACSMHMRLSNGGGGGQQCMHTHRKLTEIYTEEMPVQDGHGFCLLPPPPRRRGLSTEADDETRAIFTSVFGCLIKVL